MLVQLVSQTFMQHASYLKAAHPPLVFLKPFYGNHSNCAQDSTLNRDSNPPNSRSSISYSAFFVIDLRMPS
jgi:hypothetical protein